MKVKDAAGTGFALVLIHLIAHVVVSLFYLVTTMNNLTHGMSVVYLLTSVVSFVGGVLLDIALLLVFGSLSRTKEQLLREEPTY